MVPTPIENDIFIVFRAFLQNVIPGLVVVRGQVNRVPEPADTNYAVFWETRRRRLATNIVIVTEPFDGTASHLAEWEVAIQLDVHGPSSEDNAVVISTMMRDEYAVDFFTGVNPNVVPLHADDPKQIPFQNAEQQYEDRMVVEVLVQANQTVVAPQESAAAVTVGLRSVEAEFPAS